MSKKILISVLSCVALASSAYAGSMGDFDHAPVNSKPNGWYMKGLIDAAGRVNRAHEYGSGLAQIAASIGYKQGYLRGEGQIGYGSVIEEDYNRIELAHGDSVNFGLHGYLDLDNRTIISPYLGLGVEAGTYKGVFFNNQKPTGVGLVGARLWFTNNLALDVALKKNLASFNNSGAGSLGLAYHFN